MDKHYYDSLKNSTPIYQNFIGFDDADDELLPITRKIKENVEHNSSVEPERIKFLYSDKPVKEGDGYSLFKVTARQAVEKMINDKYDFVITVFYDVWKDLTGEQKVMALDKALCSIDMGTLEKPKIGNKKADCVEYKSNMRFFGSELIMNLSTVVDLACISAIEKRKKKKSDEVEAIDEII